MPSYNSSQDSYTEPICRSVAGSLPRHSQLRGRPNRLRTVAEQDGEPALV